MEKNNQIQVIDRAFLILETLAESKNGLGISELSRMTALHKTTVFRMLSSLVRLEYVEHVKANEKYRLSLKMFSIGSHMLENMDIRQIAHPFLQELANKTEEIAHLAILNGDEAIYIDKIDGSSRVIRVFSQLGKKIPLHCTGLGKILLSSKSDQFVEEIIAKNGFAKFTSKTITNIDDFKKELAVTRARGYALDNLEHEEGLECIAAPILDAHNTVVAAISISFFAQYVDDQRHEGYIRDTLHTANQISKQNGYRPAGFSR